MLYLFDYRMWTVTVGSPRATFHDVLDYRTHKSIYLYSLTNMLCVSFVSLPPHIHAIGYLCFIGCDTSIDYSKTL